MWITLGQKLVRSAGHLWWLCWPLASSVTNLLSLSAKQVSVNHKCSHCMSANNWFCFSSLFLINSIYPSFASLSGVKLKGGTSHSALRDWTSWWLTLLFFSWWEALFLAGKFLSGVEQCQVGEWDEAGKTWSCLLFVLVQWFSVICSMVLLKVLKWTLEVSQNCFGQ